MPFGATLTYEQDSKALRKARGAFFTPVELAHALVVDTVKSPQATVFEPSCGEACFLAEAWKRLVAMGADEDAATRQLFGCELHGASAAAAHIRLQAIGADASIEVGDFFDLKRPFFYDAVVGNPPYVRYQDFSGEAREKALSRAKEAGVALSALCSSWAPFLVVCTEMLKNGGSLGMVLPAELLTVGYAAPVRQALASSFTELEVTLFDERVFPEVQEEVILLVARGKGGSCGGCIKLRRVRSLDGWEETHRDVCDIPVDGSKWSSLLRAGAESFAVDADSFCTLGEWGRVSLGAVTGDNQYFTLDEGRIHLHGLTERDSIRIVPPGSQHLRSLVYGQDEEACCAASGMATKLFRPNPDDLSGDALAYIALGEAQEVDKRYKCRVRKPWWRVPLPSKPADLFFTYMNDAAPQLCDNRCGAFHLNSVHGVYLRDEVRACGKELLPIACLNSLTALSAELEGRQYGGGLLKMEPREAASLKVPSAQLVASMADELRACRSEVLEALSDGGFQAAAKLVDPIVLCKGEGMSVQEAESICSAAGVLSHRRHLRSKRVKRSG